MSGTHRRRRHCLRHPIPGIQLQRVCRNREEPAAERLCCGHSKADLDRAEPERADRAPYPERAEYRKGFTVYHTRQQGRAPNRIASQRHGCRVPSHVDSDSVLNTGWLRDRCSRVRFCTKRREMSVVTGEPCLDRGFSARLTAAAGSNTRLIDTVVALFVSLANEPKRGAPTPCGGDA